MYDTSTKIWRCDVCNEEVPAHLIYWVSGKDMCFIHWMEKTVGKFEGEDYDGKKAY